MSVLGIVTCEILELEFAHVLSQDKDVSRVTVLEDQHSARFIETMESMNANELHRLRVMGAFSPQNEGKLEVLVRVLELALHNRKKILQRGLLDAVLDIAPYVDAILLGYGLCGNALEKPDELLAEAGVPIFIPMDKDHPVDDCVGLLIGGRDCYYGEQCKIAGTFFMIPGWTLHSNRMLQQDFGEMDIDLAKRMFKHYERSLLILTPVMSEETMRKNIESFNETFGFRTEVREGTMSILEDTWREAKDQVRSLT